MKEIAYIYIYITTIIKYSTNIYFKDKIFVILIIKFDFILFPHQIPLTFINSKIILLNFENVKNSKNFPYF